jgi:large subunit ribosomal protein L5
MAKKDKQRLANEYTGKQRLKTKYEEEVAKRLVKEFGIKNSMAVPKIKKIVVNAGIGEATKNRELIESWKKDFATITGQVPAVQKARIAVASFGTRKGMPVGLKVTLRGDRMYSFLDKLFSIVLPRLRDFRGLSTKSFDKHGNFTLGLEEHTIFPEIDLAKVTRPFGLEVTIVTSTDDNEKAKRLLELLGMPFEKE